MNEVVSEFGGTFGLLRAVTELIIWNDTEPPDVLARTIGLRPDEQWANGDPLPARRPGGGKRRNNAVIYRSGLDDKKPTWDHLAALLEKLRPRAAEVAEVSRWPTTTGTRVWVIEHSKSDNRMIGVEP